MMNPPQRPGPPPEVLPPRPQVGIERLPARNLATEPRELMNCKSCRKRKIKCNRRRPSCEACNVFQCTCIYDAVPKKRGPKTDVLEALLKRVDGLEAKLKEKNTELEQATQSASCSRQSEPAPAPALTPTPTPAPAPAPTSAHAAAGASASAPSSAGVGGSKARMKEPDTAEPAAKRLAVEDKASPGVRDLSAYSPSTPVSGEHAVISSIPQDAILDACFATLNCTPYHILDEASVRNRAHHNQLPPQLFDAIAAVAVKYDEESSRRIPHPNGHQATAKLSRECADRARSLVDTDEPALETIQTLLLLVVAFISHGKGKKTYMLLTTAIGMAMALELNREIDDNIRVPPLERELRRGIFWTCYLLDRFISVGSRRPGLINDESIYLRLPSWAPTPSSLPLDGEFFLCGSNLQYIQGVGKQCQGATGKLIDITRILGVTHRYLISGGLKRDSHFPWHSMSNLSKIRQDLDIWASENSKMFSSLNATLNQPGSTALTVAKVIYHCVHCLIYRPFLPITLVELAGSGHQQSWQIEATSMCFFHANAITDLVEAAKETGTVEILPIVGYSLCTAGTAHIHGAYYGKQEVNPEMNMFDSSADYLAREMQMLSELQNTWGIMQKQREMLQCLYKGHGELVSRTMSGNMMRFAPGFQLEDFFDRYSNIGGPEGLSFHFDSGTLSIVSEMTDYSNNDSMPTGEMQIPTPRSDQPARPSLKRKNTSQSPHQHLLETKPHGNHGPPHPVALTSAAYYPPRSSAPTQQQPSMVHHPQTHSTSSSMHAGPREHAHVPHHSLNIRTPDITPPGNSGAMAHYGITHSPQSTPGGMGSMGGGNSFGPAYSYHTVATPNGAGPPVINDASGGYDAMFGGMPANAYSSPAGWASDGYRNMMGHAPQGAAAPSPSTRSNCGSTGTVGDEKDPFMSLLEQLANDEQRQHNGLKNELDFYLTGPHGRA